MDSIRKDIFLKFNIALFSLKIDLTDCNTQVDFRSIIPMPRRRRKYRRPQKEQEKLRLTFFQSVEGQAIPSWLQRETAVLAEQAKINEVKEEACCMLKTVYIAIGHSQPDQALIQQSKALELANQMLMADLDDIGVLQTSLCAMMETLKTSRYLSEGMIHRPFGRQAPSSIQLGTSFLNLTRKDQLYTLLKATAQATTLETLQPYPVGKYEKQDSPTLWTQYIYQLLALLPYRPYLITGSATNTMPGEIQKEELEEDSQLEIPQPFNLTRPVQSHETETGENLAEYSEGAQGHHTPNNDSVSSIPEERKGIIQRIRNLFFGNK